MRFSNLDDDDGTRDEKTIGVGVLLFSRKIDGAIIISQKLIIVSME